MSLSLGPGGPRYESLRNMTSREYNIVIEGLKEYREAEEAAIKNVMSKGSGKTTIGGGTLHN